MKYDLTILRKECEKRKIILSEKQEKQFCDYYELLTEWNKVMNLTAITEYSEVVMKHFVDSLSIIEMIDMNSVKKVIDIGTGAGFPGIPLKIVFPHIEMTLLDSLKKRIGFLDTVIEQLELKNIEAIHGRAEEYARKDGYRESYDLCVSRAVANMSTLSEYCLPYVKKGGYFIPYKSGKIDNELEESRKALFLLGGKLKNVYKFNLSDTDLSRSLIMIEKTSSTSKKYPRKAGLPAKEPLK